LQSNEVALDRQRRDSLQGGQVGAVLESAQVGRVDFQGARRAVGDPPGEQEGVYRATEVSTCFLGGFQREVGG